MPRNGHSFPSARPLLMGSELIQSGVELGFEILYRYGYPQCPTGFEFVVFRWRMVFQSYVCLKLCLKLPFAWASERVSLHPLSLSLSFLSQHHSGLTTYVKFVSLAVGILGLYFLLF